MPFVPDVVRHAVAVGPAFDPGSLIPTGRAGLIALLIILAVVAVAALLVAAAAYGSGGGDRKRGAAEDDSDLFTTTPLPMPKEELARLAAEPPPHHAFREHKLPHWVQVGSVIAALAITVAVAHRLRAPGALDRNGSDDAGGSLAADSAAGAIPLYPREYAGGAGASPFAFRARAWTAILGGGGCAARLEVARGSREAWELTARVHGAQGEVLDSARVRVASLVEGDVVEFAFPRTPCRDVDAWDVAGRQVESSMQPARPAGSAALPNADRLAHGSPHASLAPTMCQDMRNGLRVNGGPVPAALPLLARHPARTMSATHPRAIAVLLLAYAVAVCDTMPSPA